MLIRFGYLDPIFKVTGGLRLLALFLLTEWTDFSQTYTNISLGGGKMLIRFWWPWLHFQGHRRAQIVGKWGEASCPHSVSLLNGQILAKLTQICHWEGEKCLLDFGDLDPIFKVTGGLRLLENGLSASYLLKEWIDFNQTCTSILLGHVKELIRFWWPWPHFQGDRRA